MLSKVEVRNVQGGLLSLELTDISDGIVLRNIEGLDPVKATIVSSSFAQQDGTQYHSSRREERNITMELMLQPDYINTNVRDLRYRLYEYFMTKSEVKLRFFDSDGPTVDIVGRVESCEAPLFAKEPQMDISVLCSDPDFVDPTTVTLSGNTTASTTETLLQYPGTVETGVNFTLNINRILTEFTIYFRSPDGSLTSMDIAGSFVTGDVLKISTIPGAKGATLTRGGTTSSVLYAVSPQSNWFQLLQGDNHLRVYAEGAAIPYTLSYNTRYGGL
jgi:hypothetical protein